MFIHIDMPNLSPCLGHRMAVTLAGLAFALLVAPAAAAPEVAATNPWVGPEHVLVSHRGIAAFRRADMRPAWTALEREQTLEVVADARTAYVASSRGLVALDLADGRDRWTVRGGGLAFAPTLVGDRLYFANRQGLLRALGRSDGEPDWSRQFGGWIYPPAVSGQRVVTAGRSGALEGMAATDGSTVWRTSLSQEAVYRPVLIGPDRIAVSSFDGRVAAHAVDDGAELWAYRDISPALHLVAGPGALLLTRFDGRVQRVDPATGRYLWSQEIGGRAQAAPVLSAGRVLVAHSERRVSVLSADDGRVLARYQLPAPVIGSPLLLDGTLWVFVSDLDAPGGLRPVTPVPATGNES